MNPNGQDRLPPLDLPKPQTEQLPQVNEALPYANPSESISAKALEQGIQPTANPLQPPVSPAPQAVLPQDPPPQSVATQPALPISGVPAIADDADLIEKEWVEKAKEIVGHTRSDPHAQN